MDRDKIEAAADVCLGLATQVDMPFLEIAEFVKLLQLKPDWTDADVIEVQSRVIRGLLKRIEDSAG